MTLGNVLSILSEKKIIMETPYPTPYFEIIVKDWKNVASNCLQ